MSDTKQVVPSTSFPPIRSSRVALGMGWNQLALVLVAALIMLGSLVNGGLSSAATTAVVWGPLAGVGAMRYKGRAVMDRVVVFGLFFFRKFTGQTSGRVNVNEASPVALSDGETQQVRLPGMADGRVTSFELVGTNYPDASLLFDRATGLATAVVRCETDGWILTDPGAQKQRSDAFGFAMKAVAQMGGVEWVKTHARTYPASSEKMKLQAAGINIPVIRSEYEDLVNSPGLRRPPTRDLVITITVRKAAVESEIRQYGGGREGLSRAMFDRVEQLAAHLAGTGVRLERSKWLGSGEILGSIKQIFDPATVEWLEANGGVWPAGRAMSLAAYEKLGLVETDGAVHRTWWIEEWPRVEVQAGFLWPLISTGSFPHTVTQIFTPRQQWEAQRKLDQALSAQEEVARRAKKLDKPVSAEHEATDKALAARKQELAAGHGDSGMVGMITLSGTDEAELSARENFLRSNAPGMLLNPMLGQQYAGLYASLPLGGGVR